MAVPPHDTAAAPRSAPLTPAMKQYHDAKRQYRDAILFFRMGDFYEMFYEDALTAARALEITLTSRSKDGAGNAIPMCGVPFHAVDGYIAKLLAAGLKVAICEQVDDPKEAKGSAKGLTASDQITGITPPKALGNLALNAYASGADTVTLHFCNASGAAASVPAGAYKFLAVR